MGIAQLDIRLLFFAIFSVDFIIMFSGAIAGVQLGENCSGYGTAGGRHWLAVDVADDGGCDPRWNAFLMCSMRR